MSILRYRPNLTPLNYRCLIMKSVIMLPQKNHSSLTYRIPRYIHAAKLYLSLLDKYLYAGTRQCGKGVDILRLLLPVVRKSNQSVKLMKSINNHEILRRIHVEWPFLTMPRRLWPGCKLQRWWWSPERPGRRPASVWKSGRQIPTRASKYCSSCACLLRLLLPVASSQRSSAPQAPLRTRSCADQRADQRATLEQ